MSTLTAKLLSELSALSTVASGDLVYVQQGTTGYKITFGNFTTALVALSGLPERKYINADAAINHTGDGTETDVIASMFSIPTNDFVSAGKVLRFRITGQTTGVVGTKIIRVRVTTGELLIGWNLVPTAATAGYEVYGSVYARGPAAQIRTPVVISHVTDARVLYSTSTTNYSILTTPTFKLSCEAPVGDTIDVYTVEAWYEG